MSISIQLNVQRHPARYLACAALALSACDSESQPAPAPQLELRYTEYGIPHIRADSYESAGFGQGYAQARDNLCLIERGMVGFAGELSRYFGPDAAGSNMSSAGNSLNSDFYFRSLNDSRTIEDLLDRPPPLGPRAEVREMVRGFAAGFNRFLAEPHSLACSGADWLRPMTELDVYRRAYAVTLLMGQGAYFAGGIVTAEPPAANSAATAAMARTAAVAAARAPVPEQKPPGSNAIALGSDATLTGGGINVANPHLGWEGDMRWWQAQLTIPGQLDVGGAEVMGMPLVVMGHTDSVAWSITTAEQAHRVAAFELTLVDGSATTYWVDGAPEPMQRREVSVEVQRPGGQLETVTKALWWTRYGPVVGAGAGLPLPPWSLGSGDQPGHAYVMADANSSNLRMLDTLFALNHAHSTDAVLRAIRDTQGVPWWSVLAADAQGQALFSQIQNIPNVTDAHAERCNTELGRAFMAATGYAILDGSRSECAWQTDADAVVPGIFGPGDPETPRLPVAWSTNYLENSNDSYWLPSADRRITGMPRIVGDEGSERGLRTRGLITELEESLARQPATRQSVQALVLSNRSYSADLVVPATVELCRGFASGTSRSSSGVEADVRAACGTLARWDHHMDVDAPGALLFSRYWTRVLAAADALGASPWSVPFAPEDPLHTPRTLDIAAPFVAQALADAVLELDAAGIPVDARLGDYQYVVRQGKRIPIGGGSDDLAVINLLAAEFTALGFAEPFYGSGYLHVVAFDGSRCPDAVTLLSYSQSSEPTSPHHADQTELFSRKEWLTERFCEADILASPALERVPLDPRAKEGSGR